MKTKITVLEVSPIFMSRLGTSNKFLRWFNNLEKQSQIKISPLLDHNMYLLVRIEDEKGIRIKKINIGNTNDENVSALMNHVTSFGPFESSVIETGAIFEVDITKEEDTWIQLSGNVSYLGIDNIKKLPIKKYVSRSIESIPKSVVAPGFIILYNANKTEKSQTFDTHSLRWTTGLKQYDEYVMVVEHLDQEFVLDGFYINRITGATGYFDTKFVKNEWPESLPKAHLQGDKIKLKVKAIYRSEEYPKRF